MWSVLTGFYEYSYLLDFDNQSFKSPQFIPKGFVAEMGVDIQI